IWYPVALASGVLYGVYWVVWRLAIRESGQRPSPLRGQGERTPSPGPGAAAAANARRAFYSPKLDRWRNDSAPALRTRRQRLTDLIGSMLQSAIVCLVLGLVMFLF